ncbi:hypothetical protein DL93DRAFT_2067018, partial [Clavulina sp. PMI_390]
SATLQMSTHPAIKQAQDKVAYHVDQLDKELSKYPVAHQFQERTQIPKAWAFIGAVAIALISLFINPLAHPVSNLIGWALPAYLSVRAIESPGHEDDIQWLTYWVTFGTFTFLEAVALRMMLYYLPFYYVFKTIFILWLQLPATKGARVLYFSVIRPILAQNTKGPATSVQVPSPDSVGAN